MGRILFLVAALLFPLAANATPLTAAQEQAIDDSVREWLAQTGAPSVSIAVVNGGEIAYAKAYGSARLSPDVPATTGMRYAIDSNSKEFAAAAMLMLQREGRLSLDDKVSKYFPWLASADKVTIRQLLSHTAGYRDYWPQDFVPPEMSKPTTVDAILKEWGTKPLDFEPGTDWQYSNTGYVIAGAIIQKVTGQPLLAFLQSHIFAPLQMMSVTQDDTSALPASDPGAYTRYGNGPVQPAPKEGAGWLFAAGELAMTPADLARWDISLMDRSLLNPASYDAFFTSVKLKNGRDTHYSLGLDISDNGGRLALGHGGAGSGFLSENKVWPNDKVAVAAFTNNDWADPGPVIDRVAYVVLKPQPAEARARAVFDGFENGKVDRSLFTANGNSYLTPAVLADQKEGLSAFGPARIFELQRESLRGGMQTRIWKITAAKGNLIAIERGYPNGKLEQFMVLKAN